MAENEENLHDEEGQPQETDQGIEVSFISRIIDPTLGKSDPGIGTPKIKKNKMKFNDLSADNSGNEDTFGPV